MTAPVPPGGDMSVARLPQPNVVKVFKGLQGRLLLRPWYDWCGVRAVVNWYFPLSRAWAAALEADGDLQSFNAVLGRKLSASRGLMKALEQTLTADHAYQAAQRQWETAAFGEAVTSDAVLVERELERQRSSKARMLQRKAFLPWRRSFPKLRWSIPAPDLVAQRHERRLEGENHAFEAPEYSAFESSRVLRGDWGDQGPYRQYWLRFPAPSQAVIDGSQQTGERRAWAKVYEPAEGGANAPCLIFLHGIGMETDLWGEMTDPVNMLTARGFRVIRPEAPWHGHRRAEGFFGGEPAIAQGPLGFIELFHAAVREAALLIEWARRNGASRVAVGGLSLGALTAQLVATRARNWPEAQRPDHLLLVTTSEDMLDIALRGSMARLLEMPRRFAAAGWTETELARWTPLLEPHGEPVMAPDHIAVLLGRADDLTPVAGGESLLKRWRVPEDNVFRRHQGHFSASLGLYRDAAVLERLAELMVV